MIRRFFFLLLILILPLQSVWAAASAYCLHEQWVATQHVGHHDHRHHAGPADGKGETGKSALQPHADCGLCHLNCPAVPSASPVATVTPGAFVAVDPPSAFFLVFPEGPERPKWAPAA